MFILILGHLVTLQKSLQLDCLLRSFLHYRNKLAESIFDSQLFLFVGNN